ncbi:MAG: DUF2953 domain-containing protein [Clostridia bacterium]|nr:DUF2953 domain-containing protein [Clostridia bacterium]
MVLVFILLTILIILLTFFFLILLSTIHIKIQNFSITNMKEEKLDKNYAIILSLYLGNKIKWISIHLNDKKLRKAYSKMQLEKIDLKKLEKDFRWEDLKIVKKLQPKISHLKLDMQIGLENPVITAFAVTSLSSIVAIFLPYVATSKKKEHYEYVITPVYQNQNLYKIQLDCIIQVKMVHIINVISNFLKKGKSDLNERTTSHRRSYGYSYE